MNRKPKVSKENLQTAKRLLKYVTGTYKVRFVIVFICILLSSIASISVSLSLKFLIDDFISPLIGQKDPNFAELYRALAVLGSIFLMGVIATFTYTRLMVYIGQGVLKKVRDDMFEHMQTLPIRYFDQNTNGSIMSLYTNDTDTLRQMISQSIPQALMSFFTIIVTFISMLILSPLLTILAVLIIGLMIFVTKKIGGNSGKYFVRQQKSLADVTGFVEERMNGQRVVKVFNHERKSEEEFDKLNEALFESAAQANTFANMMGPVIGILYYSLSSTATGRVPSSSALRSSGCEVPTKNVKLRLSTRRVPVSSTISSAAFGTVISTSHVSFAPSETALNAQRLWLRTANSDSLSRT